MENISGKKKVSLNLWSNYKCSLGSTFKLLPQAALFFVLLCLPFDLLVYYFDPQATPGGTAALVNVLSTLVKSFVLMYCSFTLYFVCGEYLAEGECSFKDIFSGKMIKAFFKTLGFSIVFMLVLAPVYLALFAGSAFSVVGIVALFEKGLAGSALGIVGVAALAVIALAALVVLVCFMAVVGVLMPFTMVGIICKQDTIMNSLKYAMSLIKGYYTKCISVLFFYSFVTMFVIFAVIIPLIAITAAIAFLQMTPAFMGLLGNILMSAVILPLFYLLAPFYMIKMFAEFEKLQGFEATVLKPKVIAEPAPVRSISSLERETPNE